MALDPRGAEELQRAVLSSPLGAALEQGRAPGKGLSSGFSTSGVWAAVRLRKQPVQPL